MNYRSLQDLSTDLLRGISQVPREIELVVGIPRSGMLPAVQIGLLRNLNVCSLPEYLADAPLSHGTTRPLTGRKLERPQEASVVLVVDDSVAGGGAMREARRKIHEAGISARHLFLAVYATPEAVGQTDIALRIVPMPRVFQWNLLHHNELRSIYFDMDGILCLDPTVEQNDDGPAYRDFLENAPPLFLPTRRVGGIITSRLEKYREPTRRWLERHGILYDQLHMLDLPDAESRRKMGLHASFKASVYSCLPKALLYVESESAQAAEIHRLTSKPVVDFYGPSGYGVDRGISMRQRIKGLIPAPLRRGWKAIRSR